MAARRTFASGASPAPARVKSRWWRESARACSGVEPERRLVRLQGVDPPEKRVVEIGVARVAREDRGDGALDRLELVVRFGAGEIEEHLGDPVERSPAPLERLDRVGEGRGRGVRGDGVDLGPRVLDGRLEGRLEMPRRNAVEGRGTRMGRSRLRAGGSRPESEGSSTSVRRHL